MLGRIVEIAESGRHLSVHRGFMQVSHEGETIGQVPLDDLLGVVVSGRQTTHSSNLLARLAELGISFCVTSNNFSPVAMLLPIEGNVAQSKRHRLQADTQLPAKKRLWSEIVRTKIKSQAAVLERVSESGVANRLVQYSKRVRSGDPDNLEAQAARYYWPALFGEDFRRQREVPGINGLLNYGYAIIRSCMARAVVGAGLHPTIGFGHTNRNNPMCLVDDFIEPYRPWSDIAVRGLLDLGIKEVTSDAKRALAALTAMDIPSPKGVTTLFTSMSEVALSYVRIMDKKGRKLSYPELPSDLAFSAIQNELKNK